MKRKLSKVEFDALPDAIKGHYKLDGDSYLLQIEGEDDPAELRRARDREKEAARAEKERADKLQEKLDGITNADARKAGDITAIENSWSTKYEKLKTDKEAEVGGLKSQLQKLLVDNVAQRIATDLAGENADIILPHVAKRLAVEYDGETPKTRVLDADGKPSATTTVELEKEFVANKKFASIIIASKASGGADAGNRNSSNRSAVQGEKKFNELNDQERTEWYKRDPEGFKKAADESRLALRKI